MASSSSHTVRIGPRVYSGAETDGSTDQWVRMGKQRPSSGLGRSGQSVFAGLCSLSN